MAERQVSIGGTTYPLPRPFLVLATQNPIESEGVYPLPEAQRDRFLMRIPVDYPTSAEEHEIVATGIACPQPPRTGSSRSTTSSACRTPPARSTSTRWCRTTPCASCSPPATRPSYGLARSTASSPTGPARAPASASSTPAGPWPSSAAATTSLPQDIYDVAYDVLNHRLVLSFDAVADGVTVDDVLVAPAHQGDGPPAVTGGAGPAAPRPRW